MKKVDQELLTKIFSVVDGVYAKKNDLTEAVYSEDDEMLTLTPQELIEGINALTNAEINAAFTAGIA